MNTKTLSFEFFNKIATTNAYKENPKSTLLDSEANHEFVTAVFNNPNISGTTRASGEASGVMENLSFYKRKQDEMGATSQVTFGTKFDCYA